MKSLFSILSLMLHWLVVNAKYQPFGVPLLNAKITFSSINKTASVWRPDISFPRYPLPAASRDESWQGKRWHSEVGLPQWIKIQLKRPIRISEFTFRGKLSFDSVINPLDKKRGKTHYRLEGNNPNVAFPGWKPTCTIGWKTLAEEDDAKHFSWFGDDRTIPVHSKESFSCFRLFFPEVPMDNDCRHFIIVSDIRMSYAQISPAECSWNATACKCYGKHAAFMGPNRKFVSWRMYQDDFNRFGNEAAFLGPNRKFVSGQIYKEDYNDQVLSYNFASSPETVFAFEFKTDKQRPQDGPTDYLLVGKNPGEQDVVLFAVKGGPVFVSGDEVRRHKFEPPAGKTFEAYSLVVKKVGWMAPESEETHGWVQVRDVKFYVTRTHKYDAEQGGLV